MVQEVQTSTTPIVENTLETIEAIGTSSRKIIENRQTRWGHYASKCSASWTVKWYYDNQWGRQSEEIESDNLTISESTGKQSFELRDLWIRVPQAWTYQITLTWSWWSSTANNTMILRCWWNVVYTKEHTSSQTETVILLVDMWKFDLVEAWSSFYYKGSASAASLTNTYSLDIQQL
jgi:hypothetical protein